MLGAEPKVLGGHQNLSEARAHRKAGFSLIEIMLSLALVTTAVLAVMAIYTVGLRQSVRAEKTLKATEMAREILEMSRDLAFDDIPADDLVFDGRIPTPAVDKFPPAPYPARGDFQAEVFVDQLGPDLKSVCVKVYYEAEHSVNFQTYFRPE